MAEVRQLRPSRYSSLGAVLKHVHDNGLGSELAFRALGAFHQRSAKELAPLRQGVLQARSRYYPHPDDVPMLTSVLLNHVQRLWDSCTDPRDDLYVAGLALWGICCIQPLSAGNSRAALDWVQLRLMSRWRTKTRPLDLPADAHLQLYRLLACHTVTCGCSTPQAFCDLRSTLLTFVSRTDLELLRQQHPFRTLAIWLDQHAPWRCSTLAPSAAV